MLLHTWTLLHFYIYSPIYSCLLLRMRSKFWYARPLKFFPPVRLTGHDDQSKEKRKAHACLPSPRDVQTISCGSVRVHSVHDSRLFMNRNNASMYIKLIDFWKTQNGNRALGRPPATLDKKHWSKSLRILNSENRTNSGMTQRSSCRSGNAEKRKIILKRFAEEWNIHD